MKFYKIFIFFEFGVFCFFKGNFIDFYFLIRFYIVNSLFHQVDICIQYFNDSKKLILFIWINILWNTFSNFLWNIFKNIHRLFLLIHKKLLEYILLSNFDNLLHVIIREILTKKCLINWLVVFNKIIIKNFIQKHSQFPL